MELSVISPGNAKWTAKVTKVSEYVYVAKPGDFF